MADEIRFEGMDFEVKVGGRSSSDTPASDVPFRILVLGDFSGRRNRGLHPSGDSSASCDKTLASCSALADADEGGLAMAVST